MRCIFSFIWIFALLTGCKIYFGDLNIQSKADLDAFSAGGYTYVLGNVDILGTFTDRNCCCTRCIFSLYR